MNKLSQVFFRNRQILLFAALLVSSTFSAFIVSNAHTNTAQAQDNGVGQTPLMGWSTWSFLRTQPTETAVKEQALSEVKYLKSHGYVYVNLDDYWYANPAKSVDMYGRWIADNKSFPSGIPALAAYVHSLGLKFGIYVTPGIPAAAVNQNTPIEGTMYNAQDIADTSKYELNYNYKNQPFGKVMYYIDYSKPGSQEFINSWANLFASWGVDFVKLDGVGDVGNINSKDVNYFKLVGVSNTHSKGIDAISDIEAWSKALQQSGRPMYLQVSNSLNVQNGSKLRQNANSSRIEPDVECYDFTNLPSIKCATLTNWKKVSSRFKDEPLWTAVGGSGRWNDLDSLNVGDGSSDGLTNDERQSYMTLWAISAAPLYSGDNLTTLDSYGLSLLTNDEVIAVDQAGVVGSLVYNDTQQRQIWSAKESDGSYVVALFNLSSSNLSVSVKWPQLGFDKPAKVRDLWNQLDLGTYPSNKEFSIKLNPHGSSLIRVTPTENNGF